MKQIDEKVVEMRFDNKDFESNTKQTLSTLEKLKSALNFEGAGKSLDALEKSASNVKLSGISSAVESLQDRFSTLGIIGKRVIENLTDSVMNTLGNAITSVTDKIISGGVKRAMNIENAHFQLQSLLKDETKVQSIMDSAMNSVDGTAYAYDEAAKAASMFAASGVESGEDMDKALGAIANATAAVNGNYESMSQLMTKIAGQGRIMGGELLQLSGQGMNAAAMLAKYWREVRGEVNITEGDIRQMISDKDTDVTFQDVVDALNYAYEGAAKRANETFNGAAANIGAALSRIGAKFVQPLIEQNGVLVDLFNSVRIKINEINTAITPVADTFVKVVSTMSKAITDKLITPANKFTNTLRDISGFGSSKAGAFNLLSMSLSNVYESMGECSDEVQTLETEYGSLFDAFKKGAISSNLMGQAISNINSPLERALKTSKDLKFGEMNNEVGYLRTTLEHLGYDTKQDSEAFTQFGDGLKSAIVEFQKAHDLTESGLIDDNTLNALEKAVKSTKITKSEMQELNNILAKESKPAFQTFTNLVKALNQDGWEKMKDKIIEAGGSVEDFEEALKETLSNRGLDPQALIDKYGSLKEAFKANAFTVDALKMSFEKLMAPANKIRELLFDKGMSKGSTGNNVKELQTVLKELGYDLGTFGEGLDGIDGKFGKVTEAAVKAFQKAHDLNETGIIDDDTIAKLKETGDEIEGINLDIDDLLSELDQKSGTELLTDTILNSFKAIVSYIKPIKDAFSEVFPAKSVDQIHDVLESIEKLSEKLILSDRKAENLKKGFTGLFNVFKLVIDIVKKFVKALTGINSESKTVGDSIFDMIGYLGDTLTNFTKIVRESETLSKAFDGVVTAIKFVIDAFKTLGSKIKDFISSIKGSEDFQNKINTLKTSLENLTNKIGPKIKNLTTNIKDFKDNVKNIITNTTLTSLNTFKDVFGKISDLVKSFSISNIVDNFKDFFGFSDKVNEVTYEKAIDSAYALNDATKLVVKTLSLDGEEDTPKTFKEKIEETFNFQNVIDKINFLIEKIKEIKEKIKDFFDSLPKKDKSEAFDTLKEKIKSLADTINKKLKPITENIDLGDIISIVSAILLLRVVMKITEAIKNLTGAFKDLTGSIKDTTGTLKAIGDAYQKELKAEAFLKLAEAVAILAASATLLAFVDTKKLVVSILAVIVLLWTVVGAMAVVEKIKNKSKGTLEGLEFLFDGIDQLVTQYGKAKKLNAIAKVLKSVATVILAVAGSIVALGVFYTKGGKEAIEKGTGLVIGIAGAIMIYVTMMGAICEALSKGLKSFSVASIGVVLLASSLLIIIKAINKLFKIDLPLDYKRKLWIFREIFAELAALVVVIGLASRIMGEDGGKLKTGGTVISLAIMMYSIVSALNKLFKMKVPNDWKMKLGILGGIFAALLVLLGVIGLIGSKGKTSVQAGSTILALCLMLGTIVASLAILSFLPSEKLIKGAEGLGIVILAVAGTLFAAAQITKGNNVGAGSVIVALCVAIGECVIALLILTVVDWDKLKHGATVLGAIIVALGVMLAGAGQIKGSKGIGILIVAVFALAGLIAALWFLTNSIQDSNKLLMTAESISLLLVALGTCLVLISKMEPAKWKEVATTAALMTFALLSFIPIVMALRALNDCDPIGMLAAAVSIGLLLNAVASSLIVLSNFKMDLDNIETAVIALTMAMVEMLVMIIPLKELANSDPIGLIAAAVSMGILLNAVASSMIILSQMRSMNFEELGGIATLLAVVCIELLAVGLVLKMLADLPWEGLLAASIAVGITMNALATSMVIMSKMKTLSNDETLNTIKILGVAILALIPVTAALYILSSCDWAGMLAAAVSIGIVMTCLGKSMDLIARLDSNGSWVDLAKKGAILLGVLLSMVVIANVLKSFVGYPWQDMIGAATAIGETLIALSVVAGILGLVGKLGIEALAIGLAALGILIVGVGAIMAGLGALTRIDGFQELMADGAAMLELIGSGIGRFVGGIVAGFAGAASAGLAPIADALGYFAEHASPFFEMLKTNVTLETAAGAVLLGIVMAELVAEAFVGGIVTLLTLGTGFENLGIQLSSFATSALPFFSIMGKLDENLGTKTSTMTDAIKTLTEAAFINGVTNFISKFIGGKTSLVDMANQLVAFAAAMVPYSMLIQKGITEESVTASENAGKMIKALTENLPDQNGLVELFFTGGKKNLTQIALEMLAAAKPLTYYATLVEGKVSDDAVKASANAGDIIGALYEHMPRNNGWFDWIIGTKKPLKKIGEEIVGFADYIVQYNDALAGKISQESLSISKTATQMVGDLLTSLPEAGSVKGFFAGGNKKDIYDIGDQIIKFGECVRDYYDKIKDVKADVFNQVTAKLKDFLEFAAKCNDVDMGGIENLRKAMNDFGDTLVDEIVDKLQNSNGKVSTGVGIFTDNAVSAFDQNTSKFSTTGDNYLNEILGSFTDSSSTSSISNIASSFSTNLSGEKGLLSTSNLANMDKVMPEYIKEMTSSVSDSKSISSLTTTASSITDGLTGTNGLTSSLNLGKFDTSAFTEIESLTSGLTDAGSLGLINGSSNDIVSQLTSGLTSNTNLASIDTSSFDIVNSFSNGLVSTKSIQEVTNSSNNIADTLVTKIDEHDDDAFKVGKNLTQGFIDGTLSKDDGIKNAANKIGSTFLDTLRKKLDEHSPSKITKEIGDYATVGFIGGLLKKVAEVAEAGKQLGGAVIEGANDGIKSISEIFDDSFDGDPVIKPVVDLSDVTKSADDIANMFNSAILETSYNASNASSSFERQKRMNGTDENSKSSDISNNEMIQNNTFNITGSDPRETAEEVSRILQQQVERRQAVWA